MDNIIIGKRIPVGAAVNGFTVFMFAIWNMKNPELAFSVLEVGAVATFATAIVQMLVVNILGVTHVGDDKG